VTGFNHYSDCTCGWCVNHGRMSRATKIRLLDDLRHGDAVSLLKRNLARSISGCYVNPNAKCPVCGDAVYFYANEHGSRVFFDDLGPPWPKHPCTDNPREPAPPQGPPMRRTRGMTQELITAANTAGLFKNKVFGRRIPTEWTLLLVVEVERDGEENAITAEFLDSQSGETVQFRCRSTEPVLESGDFVNMKGDEISFVHKGTLIPIIFENGATIVIPEKAVEPPPSPAPAGPKLTFPKLKRAADYSRAPMTETEMVHFNSDSVGLGPLFARLEPIVKAYAREQTRKPVDVSHRLNAEGHTTAAGSAWTPPGSLPARTDVQRSQEGQVRGPRRGAGGAGAEEDSTARCGQNFDGRQGRPGPAAFLPWARDCEALSVSGSRGAVMAEVP
jgi:hypothetical protein